MEIPSELIQNWICDLRKKEIDPYKRAAILQAYLDEKKLTARELARQCNLPHSTINDWLRWRKLPQEEYNQLQEKGFNHTEIYRAIRDRKVGEDAEPLTHIELDKELQCCYKKLVFFKIKPPYSHQSLMYLKALRELLNTIEQAIEVQKNHSYRGQG